MKQYANIVDKKDESWIIEFRINELSNQKIDLRLQSVFDEEN